jgi:hypothetical protein
VLLIFQSSMANASPLLSAAIHNGLIDLLRESVEGGASVGFLAPLKRATAGGFWQDKLHQNIGCSL